MLVVTDYWCQTCCYSFWQSIWQSTHQYVLQWICQRVCLSMCQYMSVDMSVNVFLGISKGVIFCIHISNVCRKLDCHHLPSFAIGSLTSGRSSRQDHSLSLWICKATLQTASARGQKKQGDSPSYSWRRSCYQLWGPNFQRDSWHNWQSFWQHPLQHC